ncbi:MAG: hypothetical protein VXU48_04480 [Verrucomicrobiota bacterium]|nr:hypothetical protein [Verrucomicrobiota bacterium]
MKDSIDHKIDALLESHPLRTNEEFTARVLEAAEQNLAVETKRPIKTIMLTVLPIAAAIVLAFNLLLPNLSDKLETPELQSLSITETEEIFFLEESLRALLITEEPNFSGQDLLAALDTLYLEI